MIEGAGHKGSTLMDDEEANWAHIGGSDGNWVSRSMKALFPEPCVTNRWTWDVLSQPGTDRSADLLNSPGQPGSRSRTARFALSSVANRLSTYASAALREVSQLTHISADSSTIQSLLACSRRH